MTHFEFAPPADVCDDDNKISLKMEVPGVKRDDLHIHINANILSVSGERKFEEDEKREEFPEN